MVNIVTNKVARVLGKEESLRFLNLALYQGAPAKKGVTTLAMAASVNPLLQDKAARDPQLFCTAYKKQRFYLFGREGECVSCAFMVRSADCVISERAKVAIVTFSTKDQRAKISLSR